MSAGKRFTALLALYFLTTSSACFSDGIRPGQPPLLVMIIDDLGNHFSQGVRAIQLPGDLTYGIMPHTPQAKRLARYAKKYSALYHDKKEVIIHMPMESDHRLTGGGLDSRQDRQIFSRTLREAMREIPDARGLNNHMGSKLTRMSEQMDWLMAELKASSLYFIDSKTTLGSAAAAAADKSAIPRLSRDIFLDHDPDPKAIDRAYKKALRLARQRGLAVVIAHPYPTTLRYLERQLPKLAHSPIALVSAGDAIRIRRIRSGDQRIAQVFPRPTRK